MINNFEQIKQLLQFDSEDDFYHLQILSRKKDNPEIGSNSYCIKTYYIRSIEYLEKKQLEIINLCDFNNARAYINLNRRSFEQIAFQTLRKVTDQIMNKDFKSTRKAYESVCGAHSNEKEKKWIIDIDWKDFDGNKSIVGNEILPLLEELQKETGLKPMIEFIPTKNGVHIITHPFNRQRFTHYFPKIDIQTNNPTILYIP